jgi:hypothetical protein
MRLLLAFNYIVGTVAIALTARHVSAQTGIANWFVLYLVAVVMPGYTTFLHFREFRRLNVPLTKQRLLLAWSPAIAAGTTLATAIDLILRAVGAVR